MINEPPSKTWVVVIVAIIGAAGVIIAAIIGLGMPFAERLADRYYPPFTPTVNLSTSIPQVINQPTAMGANPLSFTSTISVQLPNDLTCQNHSSGYCGITVSVSWINIDPNGRYFIYAIGHGLYYRPEMWWIAGNGFSVNTTSGNMTITDGAYGNSGDSLGVFVCLTRTKYSFEGKKEILFYEKPSCEIYSQEVYFQPK